MSEVKDNANSDLKTLQNNVNELETRFDKLRQDVISKLNDCSDCIKTAKQLCHEATEMSTDLANKLANASNEEKEWKDIKAKLATTSTEGKVILDVGGEKYTTSVDTLTRVKDTVFTALFSKQWELKRDPDDKSIFIDRNGKLFTYILEYLRTDMIPNNVWKDEVLLHSLLIEAEYFRLHVLIDLLVVRFRNGTLLQPEHKKKLNELYGKVNQRWELLYKASRDGFDANAFHSRCDNKGPTMTIIQSNNNYLFGGYTSISWTSGGDYKTDTTAFLFTLTNPHNIAPTKYLINANTGHAVNHTSSYGPTFGGGHEIYLANASNANNSSYTGFSHSYTDTTGKGDATFTGAKNFTTSDIEIYKLA